MPRLDAVVCNSVAVTRDGQRCGKGEGYSDLDGQQPIALPSDLSGSTHRSARPASALGRSAREQHDNPRTRGFRPVTLPQPVARPQSQHRSRREPDQWSSSSEHLFTQRRPRVSALPMPAGRVRTARCEIRSVARDGATAQAAGTASPNTRHSPRCRRLSPSHAGGDGPPKALADRNGLATPATVNQFSAAARQWQLKVATKTPRNGLHHCCC